MKQNLLTITIDNGHLKKFQNFLKKFKKKYNLMIFSRIFYLYFVFSLFYSPVFAAETDQCMNLESVKEDFSLVLKECADRAETGDSDVAYHLGKLYLYGASNTEIDGQGAVKWFEKSFEAGNKKAGLELGMLYYSGQYVTKDLKKAQDYFMKSGDEQQSRMLSIEIMLEEARLYAKGSATVMRDERKALEIYKQVASRDSEYKQFAQIELGYMYMNGAGTIVDYAQSFYWFDLAIPNLKSINEMTQNVAVVKASMYRKAMGVKQNYVQARKIYEYLIEKYNNAAAMFELASMYAYGVGVKQNSSKAIDIYEKLKQITCVEQNVIKGYPNMCAMVAYEISMLKEYEKKKGN